jgi:hypothetical protein
MTEEEIRRAKETVGEMNKVFNRPTTFWGVVKQATAEAAPKALIYGGTLFAVGWGVVTIAARKFAR